MGGDILKATKFICRTCTFEWDALGDDVVCPFCNGGEIAPYHPLIKRKCLACAYVWTELDPEPACPVCGSARITDYVKPNKVKCNVCSHRWVSRDDYPTCLQCGSFDVCLDYDYELRYDLYLEAPGSETRQIILTVADLCTLDSASATALVGRCPVLIMDNLDEPVAVEFRSRFEDMGARVTLKSV